MAQTYVKTNVKAEDLKTRIRKDGDPDKKKLLVLEFMSQSSEPCRYMKKVLNGTSGNGLASELQTEAEFYELDIANFKQFAQRMEVEALPTFLILKRKKDQDTYMEVEARVVGVDKTELKNSIIKQYQTNPGNNGLPVKTDYIDDEPPSLFTSPFAFFMTKLKSFF